MADVKRYSNGQVRQGADLPPAEGDGGYVGDAESAPLGMDIISGKGGYVNSTPIWSEQSSGDEGADALPDFNKAGVDSTDEKASYKSVQSADGMPVTYRTKEDYDGAPGGVSEKGENDQNLQKIPPATAGEHDMPIMPQTAFTHEFGSGVPSYKK